jgi:4-hydroxy-tetrahydrodipicolinate synthase
MQNIFRKGVYTALITPFTEGGEVDLKGLLQLIEEQLDANVAGFILLGTTAETPTLTEAEEEAIIKRAYTAIKGRVPLVVGVGSCSTQKTVEKLEIATELGADAAIVVCPYYNRPTQEGLYYHFQTLAEATEIPLFLYNNPVRTGVNLELETLRRLLPNPKIVAIKECYGNFHYFMELVRSFGKELLIFSGDDIFTYPQMTLGGSGIISVASHLIPHEMVKLASLVLERRLDEALALHYKLLSLFQTLAIEPNPVPVKKGLEILGKPAGNPRLPLVPLSPHHAKTLETHLCAVLPTLPV